MIFRAFFENHRNAPATVRQQAQNKNAALLDKARAIHGRAALPSAEEFAESLVAGAPDALRPLLTEVIAALYRAEGFDPAAIPAPPPIPESIEAACWRDEMTALIAKVGDPSRFAAFNRAVMRIVRVITDAAPGLEAGTFTVRLIDTLPHPGRIIEETASVLAPVSPIFGEQYDRNRCAVSRLSFTRENRASPKLMQPSSFSGTPQEAFDAFLKDTPLAAIATAQLPFRIPDEQRGEHWHLLGGSGHGKTQTLSHIIMSDLTRPDPPALIIIDSQNQMLRQIQRLALFDPDSGPLADRLVIVDPEDDAPPALNMFAVNSERIGGYSRVAREIVEADILQLFNYIFASLSAELSAQMGTAFAYVSRLMFSMQPTATIHTLLDFLEENVRDASASKYYPHIAALDPTARSFFEKQFYKNQTFNQTRSSLARRLYDVIHVPAFERMFASPQNKLSMFDAIQRKSIICVNTSEAMLKDASPLFGRYMIASTMAAIFERVAIPEVQWRQAYLIIDEAASYFDESLEKLLRQARKYKLGVLFAHKIRDDLKPTMRAHVAANTSIKMCGGVGSADARQLAADFRSTPEFLFSQQKDPSREPHWSNWACHVRNITPHAISITVPFFALRDAPKMTEASYQKLLAQNRARYAPDTVPASAACASVPPHSPPTTAADDESLHSSHRHLRDPDA